MSDAMSASIDAPADRRREVESILATDETRVGKVWRADRDGVSIDQLIAEGALTTSNGVWNTRTLIGVLRDGDVPKAPSVARFAARKLRAWLHPETGKPLSDSLRAALIAQLAELEQESGGHEANSLETARAIANTTEAESAAVPGIYVYTLPHYRIHPVDEESGRTFLKVGHSSRDAYYRASSQGRLTALPEDPILLRIYPTAASAQTERSFHAWLEDADHVRSRTTRGGSEWFLTSTKFLDRVASSLGLDRQVINELEFDD